MLRSSLFSQLILSFYFVFWARGISPIIYGDQLLIVFYATLLSNLLDLSIPQFLYKYFKNSFLPKINFTIILLIIFGAIAAFVSLSKTKSNYEIILITLLFSAIISSNYFFTILNINNRRKLINDVEYITGIFLIISILTSLFLFEGKYLIFYITYFSLKAVILGIYAFKSIMTPISIPSNKDVLSFVKESYQIYTDKILNFSASNLEKIGAEKIFESTSLSYHFAGQQLGLKSFTLLSQYVSRAYPVAFFAKGNSRYHFERLVLIYSNLTLLFFYLFGEDLFLLLFGTNYQNGIYFFYIQLLFAYVFSLNSYQGLKFYYLNKPIFSVITTTLLFISNLIIIILQPETVEALRVMQILFLSTLINGIIIQILSFYLDRKLPFKIRDILFLIVFLLSFLISTQYKVLETILFIFLILIYLSEITRGIKELKSQNLI